MPVDASSTIRCQPQKRPNNWFPKKFGYGLMDTGAMVELASKWRNVPLQHICQSAVMKTDMQVLSHVQHVRSNNGRRINLTLLRFPTTLEAGLE